VNRSILLGRAAFLQLVSDLADAPRHAAGESLGVLSLSDWTSARLFPFVNVGLIVATCT
jgi:hypothetical protein